MMYFPIMQNPQIKCWTEYRVTSYQGKQRSSNTAFVQR